MPSEGWGKQCWYCGRFLEPGITSPVRDHMHPKSKGGSNGNKNRVWACVDCDHNKGHMMLDEYRLIVAFRKGLVPVPDYKFHGEKQEVERLLTALTHSKDE